MKILDLGIGVEGVGLSRLLVGVGLLKVSFLLCVIDFAFRDQFHLNLASYVLTITSFY